MNIKLTKNENIKVVLTLQEAAYLRDFLQGSLRFSSGLFNKPGDTARCHLAAVIENDITLALIVKGYMP